MTDHPVTSPVAAGAALGSIRRVLVVIEEGAPATLRQAVALAAGFGSELVGLSVRSEMGAMLRASAAVQSFVDDWMAGSRGEERVAEAHARAVVRQVDSHFDKFTWHAEPGHARQLVARYGRSCDMIVLRQPREDDWDENEALTGALFGSGRPVIVLPSEGKHPQTIERILIAWDDSVEAARAVCAALPLLRRAAQVHVCSFTGMAGSVPELGLLHRFLQAHGIDPVMDVDPGAGSAVTRLLAECHRRDSDMLVMGAYSRQQAERLDFGGVSRFMIFHAPLPLLLCH